MRLRMLRSEAHVAAGWRVDSSRSVGEDEGVESGAGRCSCGGRRCGSRGAKRVQEHVVRRGWPMVKLKPKEESRWIDERVEDPMAEGGRDFGD